MQLQVYPQKPFSCCYNSTAESDNESLKLLYYSPFSSNDCPTRTNNEAVVLILCASRRQNPNLQHSCCQYEVIAYIIFPHVRNTFKDELGKLFCMNSEEFAGEIVERFLTVTLQINGDAAIYVSSAPEGDYLVRDDSTFRI